LHSPDLLNTPFLNQFEIFACKKMEKSEEGLKNTNRFDFITQGGGDFV
jgi:hypothetical protein